MALQYNKPKILFVVEGAVAEAKFLKEFHEFVPIEMSEEIVTYKTNIYQLYNSLFAEGEGADLIRVLKEREKDPSRKSLLNQPFTEIYLLFDYDLHDSQYSDEKIVELMDYFDNSTENGLLLLNYPMLESYRHLRRIPDVAYRYRAVRFDDCFHYKFIVKRQQLFCDIPNQRIMFEIIHHNIDKFNFINRKTRFDFRLHGPLEDELKLCLKNTIDFKNRRGLINVMNTGSLLGYAYAPKRMGRLLEDYLLREYGEDYVKSQGRA